MTELDPKVIYWFVYALGVLFVYGFLLRRRIRHYRKHRDPRAFRDMTEGIGFFLVALAAAVAITFSLFGPKGTGIGAVLSAVASAAFLVVGIYALSEPEPDNNTAGARRQ